MNKNKIKRTHIPFLPKIRKLGESVGDELMEEIEKAAKRYNKNPYNFSAVFELVPHPRGVGHFLISQVTYEKGDLK